MSDPEEGADLTARVRSAALGSFALVSGRTLTMFLFSLVLARILGPEPFGLVAIALVFVGIGQLLVDAGAGAAVVQSERIDDSVVRSAFTLQLGLGFLFTIALATTAQLWEAFFRMPGLGAVLLWISPIFLIQSLAIVSASLMRRDLRQARLNGIQLGSYLIAFGAVAIPMAVLGWGVWSLVAGQLLQAFLMTLGVVTAQPHPWALRRPWREPSLLRFGRTVLGVNLLNIAIENLDRLVVGRRLSATDTGLYSRAYTNARIGPDSVVMALQSSLFSGFSRRQGDDAATSRAFEAALNLVYLLVTPFLAFVACLAPQIAVALYGAEWEPMGEPLRILALAMFFHVGTALSGPLLWARDRVSSEGRAGFLSLLVLALLLLGLGGSLAGAALAVAIAYGTRSFAMLWFAAKTLSLPVGRSVAVASAGVRVGIVVAAPALVLQIWLGGWPLIVVSALVGGLAGFAVIRLGRGWEWRAALQHSSGQLGPLRALAPATFRRAG